MVWGLLFLGQRGEGPPPQLRSSGRAPSTCLSRQCDHSLQDILKYYKEHVLLPTICGFSFFSYRALHLGDFFFECSLFLFLKKAIK